MSDDLPADLAHPRNDHASLYANLAVGCVLLTLTFGLLVYVGIVS